MVSTVLTLESVQSIVHVLSLPDVSFYPETLVEITAALPLVGFCFFFNFIFVAVSFGIVFVDNLRTETFVRHLRRLTGFLSFLSDQD
jgi:hypothetical protein